VDTGAIPGGIVGELEALKWRLAAMDTPDDLPAAWSAALAAEISAIRLHLKRLDLERATIADELEGRLGLRAPPRFAVGDGGSSALDLEADA
jgi:hypothetical protein